MLVSSRKHISQPWINKGINTSIKAKTSIRSHLRVIVRENQADDERWGSADSHHIFAVRYPYPTYNHGNIIF